MAGMLLLLGERDDALGRCLRSLLTAGNRQQQGNLANVQWVDRLIAVMRMISINDDL